MERQSEQEIDEYAIITVMVNLPMEYIDKPATPLGGMALMKRFIDQAAIGCGRIKRRRPLASSAHRLHQPDTHGANAWVRPGN